MSDIAGKNIVLGVSGGIAAYKACTLVSLLKKCGANVDVIMTKSATEFVRPLTFEALSFRPVITDMFNRETPWEIAHVSLAKKADCFVIAPATANIIGKIANGIADDMLSTCVIATKAPVIIAPAMNTNMLENPIVEENIEKLRKRNYTILDIACGRLACGDIGKGKMAEPEDIFKAIKDVFEEKDLIGKRVLVTAGGTLEKVDPVRAIANFSSGKMGCAVAARAKARGAEVTLVLGNHSCALPSVNMVNASTTLDMYKCVMDRVDSNDIFVFAAAPCDYRPINISQSKIKSEQLSLTFVKNPDIAKAVGAIKGEKILVAFAAESDNLYENARKKLLEKNADFIVANDISLEGAGFNEDTNIVSLIERSETVHYQKMSKSLVADIILDKVSDLIKRK